MKKNNSCVGFVGIGNDFSRFFIFGVLVFYCLFRFRKFGHFCQPEMNIDILVKYNTQTFVNFLFVLQEFDKANGFFIAAITDAVFQSRVSNLAISIQIEFNGNGSFDFVLYSFFRIAKILFDELINRFVPTGIIGLADKTFRFAVFIFFQGRVLGKLR